VHILCLDFDGVICDTVLETAVTAWKACKQLWPPRQGEAEISSAMIARFCRLRPGIETGYEAIALMRLIQRGTEPDGTILGHFPKLRASLFGEKKLETEQLKKLFATTRDTWIAQNKTQWLTHNRFYPGIPEILTRMAQHNCMVILTTKQIRFVTTLLQSCNITFPDDRIFDLDKGKPKKDVLRDLKQQADFRNAQIHFVEDRLETLLSVMQSTELQDVKLYLADWGYNTPVQRQQAEAMERITIWSLEQFLSECQKFLAQT
jgi:phosphoglycolate phosphatase-like HAD superfamily hydrolase